MIKMIMNDIERCRLRCPKCLHLVNMHKSRVTGRAIDNGFCRARYCLCDLDKTELLLNHNIILK